MFPYDTALLTAVEPTPQTIPDVLQILENIQSICIDGDGLKWFNWLYLQVTQAVEARVNLADPASPARFTNPAWIALLDVAFARYYFGAVQSSLSGAPTPGCWQALFAVRNQPEIARIQFALAGMNAHINHDLPQAVLAQCRAEQIEPQRSTPQYADFTSLNTTLDGLIQQAIKDMRLRLLGEELPPVADFDDRVAAFSIGAAREVAWENAELLWRTDSLLPAFDAFLLSLDTATAVASEALLIPIP